MRATPDDLPFNSYARTHPPPPPPPPPASYPGVAAVALPPPPANLPPSYSQLDLANIKSKKALAPSTSQRPVDTTLANDLVAMSYRSNLYKSERDDSRRELMDTKVEIERMRKKVDEVQQEVEKIFHVKNTQNKMTNFFL